MLSGEITVDRSEKVCENLLQINQIEKPDFDAIQLILNSPGGSCYSGFQLIDLIEYSKMPVYITGLGICASMGILILCSGAKGHRVITKNTSLLSHQYTRGGYGKYHDIVAARKEENQLHSRIIKHYVKHTKLSESEVKKILQPESDVWLSPKEAKKYGIVDKIIN